MILSKVKKTTLGFICPLFLMMGILLFSSVSCKSIFGPDEETAAPTTEEGTEARIVVTNKYGESLDIFMDGQFQFALGHKAQNNIRYVTLQDHVLEAKKQSTDTVVASTTISVASKIDYPWVINDPPDINVTNLYGRTLKIYMDGDYLFNLVDEENRWIIDVPYGERFLKAIRASDDKEVASITINVAENKDYSWTIQ